MRPDQGIRSVSDILEHENARGSDGLHFSKFSIPRQGQQLSDVQAEREPSTEGSDLKQLRRHVVVELSEEQRASEWDDMVDRRVVLGARARLRPSAPLASVDLKKLQSNWCRS